MNGPSPHAVSLPSRGTAFRGRLLESVVLGYSLFAGAFQSNPPSLANEPEGLARLVIAVGMGTLALAIRSRLTYGQERSPTVLILDLVAVYGCVILSQVMLAWLRPDLVLSRWAPTQGGFVGVMLFAVTRALLAALATTDEIAASSSTLPEEIAGNCRSYRARYGVAGSIALALSLAGLVATSIQVRIASTLIVIGSFCLLLRTAFARGATLNDPEAYGRARCKAILRAAALWYYGALLPASLIVLFGSKVYLYWIPIIILLFAEQNQWAAASLSKCDPNIFGKDA